MKRDVVNQRENFRDHRVLLATSSASASRIVRRGDVSVVTYPTRSSLIGYRCRYVRSWTMTATRNPARDGNFSSKSWLKGTGDRGQGCDPVDAALAGFAAESSCAGIAFGLATTPQA